MNSNGYKNGGNTSSSPIDKTKISYSSNTIKKIYPKDFIENNLIKNIGALIEPYPFIAFNLICIGIEFLGRCIDDDHEFFHDYKGRGENLKTPFNKCINEYMKKYSILIDTKYDLYNNLRCGFAHQFRPLNKLILAPINSTKKDLEDSDGKKTLNIQDFYDCFKDACNQVIENINNNRYAHPKMKTSYIEISY